MDVPALLAILSRPVGFDDPNGLVLPFLIVGQIVDVIGGKFLGRLFARISERLEMLCPYQNGNRMRRDAEQNRRLIRLQNSREPNGGE